MNADLFWTPTACRISRSRRDVCRKQVKILCSDWGMPTLCIFSRYTTTSLYSPTSLWKTVGSKADHHLPGRETQKQCLRLLLAKIQKKVSEELREA